MSDLIILGTLTMLSADDCINYDKTLSSPLRRNYMLISLLCFVGGYTTGPKQLIQLLRQKSRPYLFSNTLPPPVVGGASKVSWTDLERQTYLSAEGHVLLFPSDFKFYYSQSSCKRTPSGSRKSVRMQLELAA